MNDVASPVLNAYIDFAIEIANKFNTLFTHIGPDQSKNINYTGDKTYKTYLKEPNKVSLIF